MRVLLGITSLLAAGLVLCSCGSTNGSFFATALGITVDWPALGAHRAVVAPAAAQSAVFVLKKGAAGGHDLTLVINRDVGDAGGVRRYQTTKDARAGKFDFVMEFHADLGGQGDVVAVAAGPCEVFPDGTSSMDRTTIVPGGLIASVTVDSEQSVGIGQTVRLTYTARDAAGNVIALAPGSGVFQETDGLGLLSINGEMATGVKLPPRGVNGATVTVTLNGNIGSPVTSPPALVTVFDTSTTG